MVESGYVVRSPHEGWPGVVYWLARPGVTVASRLSWIGLDRLETPGSAERLLHRLAVADVGLRFEQTGATVLTEREVRAMEQGAASRVDASQVASQLGVAPPVVADWNNRRRWFAPPVPGTQSIHLPDLVAVNAGRMRAVEVELSLKEKDRGVRILRAYTNSRLFDQVQYHTTGMVRVAMEGWRADDGVLQAGWLHEVGVLARDEHQTTPASYVRVVDLDPSDEALQYRLDTRQVPEHLWVTKREWAMLRSVWAEHPSAALPGVDAAGQPLRIPFLTWWRQVYPGLNIDSHGHATL